MVEIRNPMPAVQVFSVSAGLVEENFGEVSIYVEENGTLRSTSVPKPTTEPIQLYGTISAEDGASFKQVLFNQAKETPESVYPGDTISLLRLTDKRTARCMLSFVDLVFTLNLKDALRNLEISRAFLASYCLPHRAQWSKRLCSVFPGEGGSATVYYSMFPAGVQASLEIKLSVDRVDRVPGASAAAVYGNIYARYSGHDYHLKFHQKYYQVMVFRNQKRDPVLLTSNSMTLPLSVPMIAVPIETGLIIEADLHVGFDEIEVANVSGFADFSQGINTRGFQKFAGKSCHLDVAVS